MPYDNKILDGATSPQQRQDEAAELLRAEIARLEGLRDTATDPNSAAAMEAQAANLRTRLAVLLESGR